MLKTYHGSCHCGAIRFEADVDFSLGTYKCNCTIDAKARMWTAKALPGGVRLIAGDAVLKDYTYGNGVAHHYFCAQCGVKPYDWVVLPDQNREYYNVSIVALDDVDMDEATQTPVTYQDGLHDDWDRMPDEIRHL